MLEIVHLICRMVEQRQVAERQRVNGNEAYRNSQFSEAYRFYTLGLEHQKHNMELHSNAALASLKMGCFIQAIEHCDKVPVLLLHFFFYA